MCSVHDNFPFPTRHRLSWCTFRFCILNTQCMLYFGFYSSGIYWLHHGNQAQRPMFSSVKCETTSTWPPAIFYFRWGCWSGHCSVINREVEECWGFDLFPEINESRRWAWKWRPEDSKLWVVLVLPKTLSESLILLLHWTTLLSNRCECILFECVRHFPIAQVYLWT